MKVITVKGYLQSQTQLKTDFGSTLLINSNAFTKSIPLAEWRYWVLKGSEVIRAIPT